MAPYPNDLCCKTEQCSDAEVVPRFLETRSVSEELVNIAFSSLTRAADKNLPAVRRTSLSVVLFDGLGSPSYGKLGLMFKNKAG